MSSSSSGWTEIASSDGPVLGYTKREIFAAVRVQRARTLELLRQIPDPDWERIIVPRWRLREVAAHIVTTDEGTLTGRFFSIGLTRDAVGGISKIEAWNDKQVSRWADRSIPEIIAGIETWGRRMERLASAIPEPLSRVAFPGPAGKVSLLWLAGLRVYDEWVHREDIRRALGLPTEDDRETILPVARHLHAGIPVQTLPRVPADATGRVGFAYSDLDLPVLGIDLGARRYGYGVSGEDARIAGPAAAVVMVAARRDPWQDAEAAGSLKIEGDRRAAEAFLDALLLV